MINANVLRANALGDALRRKYANNFYGVPGWYLGVARRSRLILEHFSYIVMGMNRKYVCWHEAVLNCLGETA